MKKLLLGALAVLSIFSALADLNGTGFYRVQNAITYRYAYLLDDKGSFNVSTSSADVNAMHLYSGFLKASSDPSTVFYFENEGGSSYNIAGQGTDLYSFFGAYLKIISGKKIDNLSSYYIYATKSGMTKYLGDINTDLTVERGIPSVDAGGDYRLWHIDALSHTGDNYFGVAPTLTVGGKYYQPFYASFQFKPYSSGVKAYVVSRVEPKYGVVVIKEVNGVVEASSPVIIECENPLASDNRLEIGPNGSPANIPTNYLKGVYFDNDNSTHYNRTAYDKNNMRSLAVVDGKLMFIKGDYSYCPRNESYLFLQDAASQAVDSYQVMKEDEFDAYVQSLEDNIPDGYYRMQNVGSSRYAYLLDNSGSASDAGAVQLYSDLLKATSDPASVLYFSHPSGSGVFERNFVSQGANSQTIFGGTLSITNADSKDGVEVFYVASSAGKLGDSAGKMVVGASGDLSQWWINAIDANSDNHFGVAPTLTAEGKYYQPFMADFPITAFSSGVKFYIVNKIDSELEVMVLNPVSGIIPAGTPVIVECANPLAADNRLVVGATGESADVAGNLLSAVYFNIAESGHINRTAYDATSMRSLSIVDGKLAFSPASVDYVPRNEAYIVLSSEADKAVENYKLVTWDEYDTMLAEAKEAVAEGNYRMQNVLTKRNLMFADNTGSLRSASSYDVGAFRMCGDILKAVSDPATVMTVKKVTNGNVPYWNPNSQTTSFAGTLASNVRFLPSDDIDGISTLKAYTIKNNKKVYFTDSIDAEDDCAIGVSESDAGSRWVLNAVDPKSDDNYFGIAPTVTAKGKYYYPFMANFNFEPYSESVKIYIVTKVDASMEVVVIQELEGSVPAGLPVIIECESPLASDNRLNLLDEATATGKGNLLKGAWFESDFDGHVNNTEFDASTMRVLGEVNGKLSFVKADYQYVPRNQAYIMLGGTKQVSIDNYEVITLDELTERGGVAHLALESFVDVYNVNGTVIRRSLPMSEVDNLPAGLYILHSGEITEKYFVH